MSIAQEWIEYKLTQLERLKGSTFRLRRYEAPTEDWDHDHCVGCWVTFAEFDGSDVQYEGYFTTVPAQQSPEPQITGLACIQEPTLGGLAFRWVCLQCFEQFREVLGFTVDAS
jgi:hypothetical protein